MIFDCLGVTSDNVSFTINSHKDDVEIGIHYDDKETYIHISKKAALDLSNILKLVVKR